MIFGLTSVSVTLLGEKIYAMDDVFIFFDEMSHEVVYRSNAHSMSAIFRL